MFNVIRNNIALFVLALMLVLIIFVYGVANSIYSQIKTQTTALYTEQNINMTIMNNMDSNVSSVQELVRTGINFIVIMVVVLTIYSSFVDKYNLSSYVTTFIISVILSSVLIYIFHNIYNTMVNSLSTTSIFNTTGWTDFIFTNFDSLILLNILAFLISFVFVKKT